MARRDDNSGELVTITTAASVYDAQVLCAALRAEGINAFIPNENSSTMLPHMVMAINPDGVPVVVSARDVKAAQAVLGRIDTDYDYDGLDDDQGGGEEVAETVDGRYDRWDGRYDPSDRDGRGPAHGTLKFDDYEPDEFDQSQESDLSEESDDFDESDWSEQSDEESRPQTAADRYAASAARSVLFTWWLPPAALWTLYCISQAMQASRQEPPAYPEQFRGNIWCAVLAGLGGAALACVVYYHIFVNL